MKRISLILSCVLLLVTPLRVSDFYQGVFTSGQPYGFWEVEAIPQTTGGQVNLAYADFNSDKYTDIVVGDNDLQKLYLLLWDPSKSEFKSNSINYSLNSNGIVSVIPNDYNFDGEMDLLVTYNKTYSSVIKYDIYVYFGNNCERECVFTANSKYQWRELDPVEPFLIDPQGKGVPEIVVVVNQTRTVLVYDEDRYVDQPFTSLVEGTVSSYPVLTKHFAATTDFNGDCFADLILVSGDSNQQYLQFYELQTTSSKYNLVKNESIPSKLQNIKYADMNSDGSVDIIQIRENEDGTLGLFVIYNTQGAEQICSQQQKFPFNFSSSEYQRVNLQHKILPTSTISVSDVNMDGYPDILITLESSGGLASYLYQNIYCSDCSKSTRAFEEMSMYQKISRSFYPVISASFFDLGEDGALDIILNFRNNNSGSSIGTVVNNLKEDSFFVKALPLSIYSSEDQLINAFGATFQWRITTLEGRSKVAYSNQLSQQSYKSLQLPFISQGLGRTNNYIQDFTVGYGGKQISTWTPIIPNSRLIITPTGSDWKLGVYVNPNTKIRDVVIITVVILIIIGLGILYLMRKEVMQDRNNPSMFFQLIR